MALKQKKEKNFSEWYTELVSEAGAHLADIRYGIQGAIVETPWAVKIIRAFEGMLEKEVEADGHEPMLLPTIVPEIYIKKEKEHVSGFAPELYWVTEGGGKKLEEKYYLGRLESRRYFLCTLYGYEAGISFLSKDTNRELQYSGLNQQQDLT